MVIRNALLGLGLTLAAALLPASISYPFISLLAVKMK